MSSCESDQYATTHNKHLQDLLRKHYIVNVQIRFINAYISRLRRQAVKAMLLGHKGQALHYMGRKSIVETIKYFYKQYRQRQWYYVQTVIFNFMRATQPSAVNQPPVVPDNHPGDEGKQVEKYSQTMMVAFCNFNRCS